MMERMTIDSPEAAPTPFHRLALLRQHAAWWRPLLTGVLAIVLYLAMMLVILVPLAIAALTMPEVEDVFTVTESFDLDRPWLFIALTVPLILMIPALLAASRIVQGRGVGLLWSVAGRVRWGWLWRTLWLAFALYTAYFGVFLVFDAATGAEVVFDPSHPGIALMIVLVLLLIPFQAAAEEYVFRGYLMQLVGRWLRHPAFAIVLPAPLFVLGHGYDIWGGLSVGVFAVVAAWLSWRTGGLEAAISMHIANNALIFLLASFSLVDGNATEGTPIDLITGTVVMVVYALIADRWARARSALTPGSDATPR